MLRFFRSCAAALALVLAPMGCAAAVSGADSVATRLRALADAHDFQVQGMERVGDEPAVTAAGDLTTQLRQLLSRYNHMVEGVPPSVQRVIVIGPKSPARRALAVQTTRRQGHHVVNASLQGLAGHRATVALMVDTGASTIVLPDSMIAPLGFRRQDLREQRGQTVNGVVTGRAARLASVAVGNAVVRDVAVLFVADDRLGGAKLLGMSFLGRFSLTIDKADNRLVLTPQ